MTLTDLAREAMTKAKNDLASATDILFRRVVETTKLTPFQEQAIRAGCMQFCMNTRTNTRQDIKGSANGNGHRQVFDNGLRKGMSGESLEQHVNERLNGRAQTNFMMFPLSDGSLVGDANKSKLAYEKRLCAERSTAERIKCVWLNSLEMKLPDNRMKVRARLSEAQLAELWKQASEQAAPNAGADNYAN